MTADQPQWARDLQAAAAKAGEALGHVSHVLTAQEAMGWMYRGDLNAARHAIAKLPDDKLVELSAAAAALAALADEETTRRAHP
ncbi:hypothetical protein [Streptosporangium roseum]|uniref:hypothetical protein n=1 Tax=Streptosporangium roseum TaxID=2001 RepID=UPI0004CCD66D|nr:hypothetical protein [Streptosporangium roseum]